MAGFVTHAATVHVYWTIRRNTYSPGLLTSLLYVLVFYLLIRYGLGPQLVTGADFAIGTAVGVATVGAFLTVGPTLLFPRLTKSRRRLDSGPKGAKLPSSTKPANVQGTEE